MTRQRGSVAMFIIFIVVVIILLGYFGINIQRDIVGNQTISGNFSFVYYNLKHLWDTYLYDIVLRIWHWAVVNITNLPVGSGNGIQIPQVTYPGLINAIQATDVMNGQPQVRPY